MRQDHSNTYLDFIRREIGSENCTLPFGHKIHIWFKLETVHFRVLKNYKTIIFFHTETLGHRRLELGVCYKTDEKHVTYLFE